MKTFKVILSLWLAICASVGFGQSNVEIPQSGKLVTEEQLQNYVFEQMEKYVKADCDLKVTNIVESGNTFEFGLSVSLPNATQFTIKAQKGERLWYWNNVPYVTGGRIRIQNVPPLDSLRVTIRPSAYPTCYFSFGLNNGGTENPDPGGDTTVVIPNCKAGPIVNNIYNITRSGLTAQFHGEEVTLIKYSVKTPSGTVLRTGEIAPTSSILNLSFSSDIMEGSYILRLEGVNCNGFSEKPFELLGTDLPPPGNVIAKKVVKGLDEHMNIEIVGTGESKIINDLATVVPPDGYEFLYIINDKQYRRATRLTNFPWPSEVDLGIQKFQVKPSLTSLNNWGQASWQDPEGGRTFSFNATCAFTNIFFEQANTRFDPTKQVVQWMDYMPDMPATDGKVWVMPKGPISTITQLQAKGVTTFTNYEIVGLSSAEQLALSNAGKTYNEVPQTMSQLNLNDTGGEVWVRPANLPDVYPYNQYPFIWNNAMFHSPPGALEPMTHEQATAAGNSFDTNHALIIFENSEQRHAVGAQWSFWKPYYSALTTRLQSKFPGKWRVAHNYFTGAVNNYPETGSEWEAKRNAYGQKPGILGFQSRAQAKAFLSAPISDWPSSNLLPGGNMEDINSACYGIYLNAPDLAVDNAYRLIFASHLTHAAGKYEFVFAQSFYEWFPNNYQETIFPEGKFYKQVKMPHNPAQMANYAFLSRVFADGFIPFSASSKTDGSFRYDKQWWGATSLWYPNGATSPQNNDTFPYWKQPGQNEAFATSGFEEYVAKGMYIYDQSFAKTSGGTRSFLRYRLDGGAWMEAQNNSMYDLVDAYFDKRGICMGEVKSGKLAVMYMNPYADGAKHTLEYQYNGVTRSMPIASTLVHTQLITL